MLARTSEYALSLPLCLRIRHHNRRKCAYLCSLKLATDDSTLGAGAEPCPQHARTPHRVSAPPLAAAATSSLRSSGRRQEVSGRKAGPDVNRAGTNSGILGPLGEGTLASAVATGASTTGRPQLVCSKPLSFGRRS